jgi:TolB protein
MKKTKLLIVLGMVAVLALFAQQSDMVIKLVGGERAAIAVPDFRGTGEAQRFMGTFNETLWNDLQGAGLFKMAPKSMYPLQAPQQPRDFKAPLASVGGRPPVKQGPWLTDWSQAPVSANYLAFGYSAVQDNQLVVFGYLFNVTVADIAGAQALGKPYFGPVTEDGARKVAHEFAADILSQFGAKSLFGTKIYFASDRSGRGTKEIWSMDPDGANQTQLTFYKSISTMPAVSPDGTKIAFTSFAKGTPQIMIHSLTTKNRLNFFNQPASLNATADFSPDGTRLVYASSATGVAQIYSANLDGSSLRRISTTRAIEVEPKINPRNPSDIVFVSGRSGLPQIYKMNMDGADVTRLTDGNGEAVNPSWHPDGQHIAFAWTKGFDPGNYNIFVMDVASRETVQLTHGSGRNENPSWAPDGRHLVFTSTRGGSSQIWTMLANGTQAVPLTTQGRNEKPVWSR